VVGPAGLPPAVVKVLNESLASVLATPDLRDKLSVEAIEPRPMSPPAFAQYIRTDLERWTRLAKDRNIQLDS
jgi:tripartite-type tricarboxylate transporter receptor subunit TctC